LTGEITKKNEGGKTVFYKKKGDQGLHWVKPEEPGKAGGLLGKKRGWKPGLGLEVVV